MDREMESDSLATIRQVRASLTSWLDAAFKLPDPTAQPPGTLKGISAQIELVGAALRSVSPAVSATQEWKTEIAAYAEILRELRARLANFEIALKIRRNQMHAARANLRIARSWADLAKHIG